MLNSKFLYFVIQFLFALGWFTSGLDKCVRITNISMAITRHKKYGMTDYPFDFGGCNHRKKDFHIRLEIQIHSFPPKVSVTTYAKSFSVRNSKEVHYEQ